jgi:hypothetical protein
MFANTGDKFTSYMARFERQVYGSERSLKGQLIRRGLDHESH